MTDGRWINDGPVMRWQNDQKVCKCKTPILGDWNPVAKNGRCMCGGLISEVDLRARRKVKR